MSYDRLEQLRLEYISKCRTAELELQRLLTKVKSIEEMIAECNESEDEPPTSTQPPTQPKL